MKLKQIVAPLMALLIAALAFMPVAVGQDAGAAPSAAPLDEAACIAVLESDAEWAEKQAACRRLRQVGTAAAVPALAALLNNPELSQLARYALEPMSAPEAGQALREALGTTEGGLKTGVVISLGARHDAEAVGGLLPLLQAADADLVRATAAALGRIASDEAVAALLEFQKAPPAGMAPVAAEALLAAAQRLLQERKPAAAVGIYELLVKSDIGFARMGAFAGLLSAEPDKTIDRVLHALGGDDAVFRNMAAETVASTSGAAATQRYAKALESLPTAGQVALLRGLGDRGDTEARRGVAAAVNSEERAVQLAAINALGRVGNPTDAGLLTGLLGTGDEEVIAAAKASLRGMQGRGIDERLAGMFPSTRTAVRAHLLDILSDRVSPHAVGLAVEALRDADAGVRVAALNAVGNLGGKDEAPAVLAALDGAPDASERSEAAAALGAISARYGDEVLPALAAAMQSAGVDAKLFILRNLDRIATPGALKALVDSLNGDEPALREEAARVLSNWPNPEALPHLLALAQGDDAFRKDLGLRGYVRLARLERAADKKTEMLQAATAIAKSQQERWLVLAAWGTLATEESLNTLLPNLDDPEVRNEAASAVIAVAAELGKHEPTKARAREALGTVLVKCESQLVKDRAQAALDKLG